MRTLGLVFVVLFVAIQTQPALAQAVSVQLPRQDIFSVGTVVSVPDRGGVFLGGVKRAADSRSQYGFGPLRAGSSIGTERSASNLSAHVYIHDFDEMDRMLLNTPTVGGLAATDRPLEGLAGHAHRQLTGQQSQFASSGRTSSPLVSGGRQPLDSSSFEFGTAARATQSAGSRPPLARIVTASDPTMASRYRREAARASLRGQSETANLYLRLAQQCDGEADAAEPRSPAPISIARSVTESQSPSRELSLRQRDRRETE
jgi:hypothetical protein